MEEQSIYNKNNKKKVYISGKITGIEIQSKILFARAQAHLEGKGWTVVNPWLYPIDQSLLVGNTEKQVWQKYMKQCINLEVGCDAVYFLTNWIDSPGAMVEFFIAEKLGLEMMFEVVELSKIN